MLEWMLRIIISPIALGITSVFMDPNCIIYLIWYISFKLVSYRYWKVRWSKGDYIHDTPEWYVVLEVFCVVYVGKPPTQHVVVGLPTCVVGGKPTTCCCWFTNMCCWR